MKVIIVGLLIVATAGLNAVNAGFAGFFCPSKPNGTIFDSCSRDCREQHGSFSGVCGRLEYNDFNCYCGRPSYFVPIYEKSLTCREPTIEFRDICHVDCICNHAAITGICNWQRKVCVCLGRDVSNRLCPLKTSREFGDYYIEQLGIEAVHPRVVERIQQL